jgi:aspartate aminotransferase-like enzyme
LTPLKQYLLTAGPTPVPERVLLAMAQPMVFHRTPAFSELLDEVQQGLRWVYRTQHPVLTLVGSGTAGMEAAVTNFCSRGDKVLCIRGGRFGDQWAAQCKAFGVETVDLPVEWGSPVDAAEVERALAREPRIRAVFATASESSTGVAHPIEQIAAACRDRDVLCIVDAISALGAFDVPQDAWGIDVLVCGSQKALMLPPGLAFVGVSARAWKRAEQADLPRYYLDLVKRRRNQEKGEPTWTPAVSLMVGLRESLRMMKAEGLEAIFERHRTLAAATRAACVAIGCQLFAKSSPSPSVTSVEVPPGIDGAELMKTLRTRHGITLSGGQEHLAGKIFRIAHLGYFGAFDVITAVSGLELALTALGHRFEPGAGVAAAERVFGEAH